MDGYDWVRVVHLLAMAFFVGGQMVLLAAIVPVLRGRPEMKRVARLFGWGSLVAIFVALVTGMVLGIEYDRFGEPAMHAKLGLLVVVAALLVLHMQRPASHAIQGLTFLGSLGLVALGVVLAH